MIVRIIMNNHLLQSCRKGNIYMKDMISFIKENQKEIQGCECGEHIKIFFSGSDDEKYGMVLHGNIIDKDSEGISVHTNLMTNYSTENDSTHEYSCGFYLNSEQYDSDKNAYLIGNMMNSNVIFDEYTSYVLSCLFLAHYNRSAGITPASLIISKNKIYFRPNGLDSTNYDNFGGIIEITNVSGFIAII